MLNLIRRPLFCVALVGASFNISLSAKKTVESADDLPRISYAVEQAPSEILKDRSAVLKLAKKVKSDVESILEEYDIQDNGTIRGYHATLLDIALLKGDYDLALEYVQKVRGMQEKPADKMTSGLSVESMIAVLKSGEEIGTEGFSESFQEIYAEKIKDLPWEIVQDNIESAKGSMEMMSENLLLGLVQAQMDPGSVGSQQIDFGGAATLVSFRVVSDYILKVNQDMVVVLSDYIDSNRVEKADIWEARSVDLSSVAELSDVVVAIWDSGVDMGIFEEYGQTWKNESEVPGDGIDNDENGWIDDVYGIAHDLKGFKVSGDLMELPEAISSRYGELINLSKGLSDLQAAIDSEEATELKKYMSTLEPEAVESFLLDLGYFGNYTHGTHVAGIAAEGNPAAKIMNVRITFDHKVIPDAPTLEESVRGQRATLDVIDYLKANGVRVVNMSWGGTQAGLEGAFEANGMGDDSEMRAEMARILYELSYDSLVEAMASAPEILFVPAAGNSDEDVDFNKVIPSSISLSNVLVAGAVDQAGDETDFTSYGKNVRVHANGFEVDSYLPGGERQKFSGTSMSAPNVTNLAAKLFALDPSLTPKEVISLILLGADTTEDGRRHLMNPKKSIQLLAIRNGMTM